MKNGTRRLTELDYAKTLAIIMLLSVIHFLTKDHTEAYPFFRYCGTNLTTIYIIQWMIIGWTASFQDYLHVEPGFGASIGLGILIAFIAIGISKIVPPLKR